MAFALPDCPPARDYDVYLDTLRNEASPSLGGPDDRFPRLGSRHRCDVTLENMTASQARVWRNRLMSEDQTVVWTIPTKGLDIGNPGAPVVDGGDQSGSTIALRGLTPEYLVVEDQFIPIVTGGRVYLYKARGQVQADSAGDIEIPLNCILRIQHENGDTVELAEPVIEGFARDVQGFSVLRRRAGGQGLIENAGFAIKERR